MGVHHGLNAHYTELCESTEHYKKSLSGVFCRVCLRLIPMLSITFYEIYGTVWYQLTYFPSSFDGCGNIYASSQDPKQIEIMNH